MGCQPSSFAVGVGLWDLPLRHAAKRGRLVASSPPGAVALTYGRNRQCLHRLPACAFARIAVVRAAPSTGLGGSHPPESQRGLDRRTDHQCSNASYRKGGLAVYCGGYCPQPVCRCFAVASTFVHPAEMRAEVESHAPIEPRNGIRSFVLSHRSAPLPAQAGVRLPTRVYPSVHPSGLQPQRFINRRRASSRVGTGSAPAAIARFRRQGVKS